MLITGISVLRQTLPEHKEVGRAVRCVPLPFRFIACYASCVLRLVLVEEHFVVAAEEAVFFMKPQKKTVKLGSLRNKSYLCR